MPCRSRAGQLAETIDFRTHRREASVVGSGGMVGRLRIAIPWTFRSRDLAGLSRLISAQNLRRVPCCDVLTRPKLLAAVKWAAL